MSNAPVTSVDALIIGAGPIGLYQAFQLGLLEITCHIVDSQRQAGGQCGVLYPDKPIYDIPGIPTISGKGLIEALTQQCLPLHIPMHWGQQVSQLARQSDGQFLVQTTQQSFITKTIFIAAGAGAFVPRKMGSPELLALEGQQVFFDEVPAPCSFPTEHIVVLGDNEQALHWACAFAQQEAHKALHITLVHRRDAFSASAAQVAQMQALRNAGKLDFVPGQITGQEIAGGTLTHLNLALPDGSTQALRTDKVLGQFGLSPKLGPLTDWGLAMARKQLVVDTEKFQTTEPGIFAVGDINTYPGKKKLIVCGFHECVLAAFAAAEMVFPGKPHPLQYTTTSTRLHQRLGVSG